MVLCSVTNALFSAGAMTPQDAAPRNQTSSVLPEKYEHGFSDTCLDLLQPPAFRLSTGVVCSHEEEANKQTHNKYPPLKETKLKTKPKTN